MKRKREEDDTIILDIIKRVKRCFDISNKKRKREENSDDDDCCAVYARKRLKIDTHNQCSSNFNNQYRRDILVYL